MTIASKRLVAVLTIVIAVLGAITGLTIATGPGRADAERQVQTASREPGVRLVVFEAPDCGYCALLRRDVLRPYFASDLAHSVPMEVVDFDLLGTHGYGLGAPIQSLPTTVVFRGDQEVARITGFLGREKFFAFVERFIIQRPGKHRIMWSEANNLNHLNSVRINQSKNIWG